MSASKQKKLRSNSDAVDKKVIAAQEKAVKDKKFRRNVVIFVVIFALLIAVAVFINSNALAKLTAVEVNGTKYSAVELNFYYTAAYNQFYEQYSDYIAYFIDTSTPLNMQECTIAESGTWADYFTEEALALMEESTALYNLAIANGYTIDEEISNAAQSNITYLETVAKAYGYASVDAYLEANYCKGMTAETYIDVSSKYMLATKYASECYYSFEYTPEQLDAAYAEVADTYDSFTYNFYYIAASSDAYASIETDEAKLAAAEADAQKFLAATSEEEFNAIAAEISGNEPADSKTTTAGSGLISSYSEWMMDAARTEGDVYTVSTTSGVYAVRFIGRESCEYNTVNVRHILVSAELGEDGTASAEALAEAYMKAEELYNEWKLNPTEENFIAMANEHSDDTAVDGLYEKVYKNQMVAEFNSFCFGEPRQTGDTALIYGSNGAYAGYHIVYFVGENEMYSRLIGDGSLRNNDYNAFIAEATANSSAELKWASRFAALD